MVRKAKEIRSLLTRRMDMWEVGKLPELLHEAMQCDKQIASGLSPMISEQLERTFNRLMIKGRIHSAVRLVTDRGGCGVLPPEAEAHGKNGPLGISVYDVFKEKYPVQRTVDPSAFIECEELPPFEHVDITAAHIEVVVRCLFGSAGPSGTSSEQRRAFYALLWNS